MAHKAHKARKAQNLGFAPAVIAGGKAILPALLTAIASATPYILEKLRKVDFNKVANDAQQAKELYSNIKKWRDEEKGLQGTENGPSTGQVLRWGALAVAGVVLYRKVVKATAEDNLAVQSTRNNPPVTLGMNAAMAAREFNRLLNAFNVDEDRVFALLRGLGTRRNFNTVDAEYRRAYSTPLLRDLEKVNTFAFDSDYDKILDIVNSLR